MHLSFSDFLLFPVYLVIIYYIGRNFKESRIANNPVYAYYLRGLMLKIGGGVFLVFIYTYYYNGGDTTAYFESAVILERLRAVNFSAYIEIMGNNLNQQTYSYFTSETAWPQYFFDKQSFTVVRAANIVNYVGFNSYLLTTVVLAALTYNGIWRLFLLFAELYPKYVKQLAYSILFVPSVLFWGSGILKDTLTLMGACWFTFSFYKVFIKREKIIVNAITMVLSALFILQMKPYIFIALVPGALIWFSFDKIQSITSPIIKFLVAPLILTTILGIGFLTLSSISDSFGQYSSIDKIIDKAIVNQQDLKMDYNKGQSFDIGEFDGTAGSIGRKFPLATFAGLFFPQLWQVKNPVMLLAALENSFLLVLTLLVLFRVGPLKIYGQVRKEPLLIFSLVFSIFFAFSVGLTTSNFGALVRYKIPAVPFYFSAILILYQRNKEKDKVQEEISA
jgi:hypothetical protein